MRRKNGGIMDGGLLGFAAPGVTLRSLAILSLMLAFLFFNAQAVCLLIVTRYLSKSACLHALWNAASAPRRFG